MTREGEPPQFVEGYTERYKTPMSQIVSWGIQRWTAASKSV